jgi:hypothetical protein
VRACQEGKRTVEVNCAQDMGGMDSRGRGCLVEVEVGSKPRWEGVRRALRLVEIESSIWERERRRKSRRKRVLKQKVGVSVGQVGGSVMMRFCEWGVWRGREEGGEGDGVGVAFQNHASLMVFGEMCSSGNGWGETEYGVSQGICMC